MRVARLAAFVALGLGQRLGLRQGFLLGELVRPQPPARDGIPVKIPGRLARDADLEGAAQGDDLMPDDADAVDHLSRNPAKGQLSLRDFSDHMASSARRSAVLFS